MCSNVTGEDCAYIVQKLQRVAGFMQRVVAPPHSDEHASLQALKLYISAYTFSSTDVQQSAVLQKRQAARE